MRRRIAFLAPALVLGAIAADAHLVGTEYGARNVEPCAQVSSWIAQAKTTKGIPATMVYDCLMSMPFDGQNAVTFANEFRKYLQFQSTIETLKNPPKGYLMPPTDLMGGLDSIAEKAQKAEYANYYSFELDLRNLINSAYDAHLSLQLCSTSLFRFSNSIPLVSVSADGLKLPLIYTLNDAQLLAKRVNSVSSVASINNQTASEYLKSFTSGVALHDPDAQYNTNFPSLAFRVATGGPRNNGYWSQNMAEMWDGDSISLKFANGTTVQSERTADLFPSDFPYQNGTALFNARCRQSPPTTTPVDPTLDSGGYPNTTWTSYGGLAAGYFSNETELQDVGILSVATFAVDGQTLQDVSVNFLRNATKAGKKKIFVDVSANPGGDINSGMNLFHIFFPDTMPYSATRFRTHDANEFLVRAFSQLEQSSNTLPYELWEANPFSWQAAVTPDQNGSFSSWENFYGPNDIQGAELSSLYANFNLTSISTPHDPIIGYGSIPLDPSSRLYAPEDIVIITDGNCISTCAYFVDRMQRAGVRTVVFGGRPQPGPMQAIGGTRGAQNLAYASIYSYISTAHGLVRNSLTNGSSSLMTAEEWAKFNQSVPVYTHQLPIVFGGSVNLRNEYAPDDDETPQQFTYQAADCRLFYTAENWFSQESVWKAAATALFSNTPTGSGVCVEGSVSQ